jgi:hypothetical protein
MRYSVQPLRAAPSRVRGAEEERRGDQSCDHPHREHEGAGGAVEQARAGRAGPRWARAVRTRCGAGRRGRCRPRWGRAYSGSWIDVSFDGSFPHWFVTPSNRHRCAGGSSRDGERDPRRGSPRSTASSDRRTAAQPDLYEDPARTPSQRRSNLVVDRLDRQAMSFARPGHQPHPAPDQFVTPTLVDLLELDVLPPRQQDGPVVGERPHVARMSRRGSPAVNVEAVTRHSICCARSQDQSKLSASGEGRVPDRQLGRTSVGHTSWRTLRRPSASSRRSATAARSRWRSSQRSGPPVSDRASTVSAYRG